MAQSPKGSSVGFRYLIFNKIFYFHCVPIWIYRCIRCSLNQALGSSPFSGQATFSNEAQLVKHQRLHSGCCPLPLPSPKTSKSIPSQQPGGRRQKPESRWPSHTWTAWALWWKSLQRRYVEQSQQFHDIWISWWPLITSSVTKDNAITKIKPQTQGNTFPESHSLTVNKTSFLSSPVTLKWFHVLQLSI